MKILILGFGYSAGAFARELKALEPEGAIVGTVRHAEKAAELEATGVQPFIFDGDTASAELLEALASATHLLVSVPPDGEGDPVLRALGPAIAQAKTLQWIGYLSTVGVYGDFGGAWIDETAPCQPVNPRSQMRVRVEGEWRDLARQKTLPLLILRLAGIYGPGRSGFNKLRNGTARRINKPGQVFNRIHVADIGRITALAALRGLDGTFNLSDNHPAPPQEVMAHAAELLGVPTPPEVSFAEAEMTPMARSFYQDNKRVCSTAILRALSTELQFSTYREGLAAVLAEEQSLKFTQL